MKKNGGQGNKRALKEKKIEVSVEIVLKKIEGYVIKNYLYLINVEVSRSINFNFNRQSTDKLPTDYQQSADMLPTVGRLSADRSLKLWKKTVGRQLAYSRPTVGGGELFFTITQIPATSSVYIDTWKYTNMYQYINFRVA